MNCNELLMELEAQIGRWRSCLERERSRTTRRTSPSLRLNLDTQSSKLQLEAGGSTLVNLKLELTLATAPGTRNSVPSGKVADICMYLKIDDNMKVDVHTF